MLASLIACRVQKTLSAFHMSSLDLSMFLRSQPLPIWQLFLPHGWLIYSTLRRHFVANSAYHRSSYRLPLLIAIWSISAPSTDTDFFVIQLWGSLQIYSLTLHLYCPILFYHWDLHIIRHLQFTINWVVNRDKLVRLCPIKHQGRQTHKLQDYIILSA